MSTDIAGDVVVQVEGPGGVFAGHAFSGVPAARPSWIAIAASGSGDSLTFVQQIRDEIGAVLSASSPEVRRQDVAGVDPSQLATGDYPDRRKVLVLVASDGEPFVDRSWYTTWDSDASDACVMTVVPSLRLPKSFRDLLPSSIRNEDSHLLQRINASVWKTHVAEVVPSILARAEVTSAVPRVFLSYRRHETADIAMAVFDALAHEGFEVFLDQFSIPPGYDFQRRLNQELQDKSMVVVLESKYVGDSKWTQHEIDFAKRHRLGFLAIRMPDADPVSIPDQATCKLDEKDFSAGPTLVARSASDSTPIKRWPAPSKDALARVVADIKAAHAAALFRRRQRLRSDLIAACTDVGLSTNGATSGPLLVKAAAEHLVWLTTRPAEVDDFHSLSVAQDARQQRTTDSRAIIVGPHAMLEPDRQVRLTWLQRVTSCLAFDEGNLADVAGRLRDARWPS